MRRKEPPNALWGVLALIVWACLWLWAAIAAPR